MSDKFAGVLQHNDGEGNDSITRNKLSKFDQMLEAQMVADILRANTNLKSLRQFRTTNEKYYQDKSLEEARKKEIREPLEQALLEIDILNGKLNRREEIIKQLRRQLYNDVLRLRFSNVVDESRNQIQEMHQSDEWKQLQLIDIIDQLKLVIELQQKEITKGKRAITFQTSKIKDLINEREKMIYEHKEQIRKIESDKDIYFSMLETRENKIEYLMEEKDNISEELANAESSLEEKTIEAKKYQNQAKELQTIYDKLTEEHTKLIETNIELDRDATKAKEDFNKLTEQTFDLRNRYDNLVLELDKMVEEGYYIPSSHDHDHSMIDNNQRSINLKSNSTHEKRKTIKKARMSEIKQRSTTKGGKNIPGKLTEESLMSSASGVGLEEESSDLPFDEQQANQVPVSIAQSNQSMLSMNNSMMSDQQQSLGKFMQRKMEEDALAYERIHNNASFRMREILESKIKELEEKNFQLMNDGDQNKAQSNVQVDNLQFENRILNNEVNKLTNKMEDMEKTIQSLKNKLEAGVSLNPKNFEKKKNRGSLVQRLSSVDFSHSFSEPIRETERESLVPEVLVQDQLTMQPIEDGDGLEANPMTQSIDEFTTQTVNNLKNALGIVGEIPPPETNFPETNNDTRSSSRPTTGPSPNQEEGENYGENSKQMGDETPGEGQNIDHNVDMLSYMFAWENVIKNSKDIQYDFEPEVYEEGIQCDLIFEQEGFFIEEEESSSLFHEEGSSIMAEDGQIVDDTADASSDLAVGPNPNNPVVSSSRPSSRFVSNSREGRRTQLSSAGDDPGSRRNTPGSAGMRFRHTLGGPGAGAGFNRPNSVDPQIQSKLKRFYKQMQRTCTQLLPNKKQEILELDPKSSHWPARLVDGELLPGLDIEWQVHQALVLIVALNDLRNEFVKECTTVISKSSTTTTRRTSQTSSSAGVDIEPSYSIALSETSISPNASPKHQKKSTKDEQKAPSDQLAIEAVPIPMVKKDSKSLKPNSANNTNNNNPKPASNLEDDNHDEETSNVQITHKELDPQLQATVHLIDTVLQSLHHLLSPLHQLQQSQYPDIHDILSPPQTASGPLGSKPSSAYASRRATTGGGLEGTTPPLPTNPAETFPLTQPKVILTVDSKEELEQTHKKKELLFQQNIYKIRQFMNKSAPRELPMHIDDVLEMVEKRSRSSTAASQNRPSSQYTSSVPSNNHSAIHSRSSSPSRGNTRGENRSPSPPPLHTMAMAYAEHNRYEARPISSPKVTAPQPDLTSESVHTSPVKKTRSGSGETTTKIAPISQIDITKTTTLPPMIEENSQALSQIEPSPGRPATSDEIIAEYLQTIERTEPLTIVGNQTTLINDRQSVSFFIDSKITKNAIIFNDDDDDDLGDYPMGPLDGQLDTNKGFPTRKTKAINNNPLRALFNPATLAAAEAGDKSKLDNSNLFGIINVPKGSSIVDYVDFTRIPFDKSNLINNPYSRPKKSRSPSPETERNGINHNTSLYSTSTGINAKDQSKNINDLLDGNILQTKKLHYPKLDFNSLPPLVSPIIDANVEPLLGGGSSVVNALPAGIVFGQDGSIGSLEINNSLQQKPIQPPNDNGTNKTPRRPVQKTHLYSQPGKGKPDPFLGMSTISNVSSIPMNPFNEYKSFQNQLYIKDQKELLKALYVGAAPKDELNKGGVEGDGKPRSANGLQATRPSSGAPPSTRYYAPRVQRQVLVPSGDVNASGLEDAALFIKPLQDDELDYSNNPATALQIPLVPPPNAPEPSTLNFETSGDFDVLAINGKKKKTSLSNKERVTGTLLYN